MLSCAPAEVEAALSYSSLADLLAGVEPEVLAVLPTPQRDALEVALLRAGPSGAVAGQRAVAMGALSVLEELAAATPVVVAIDDVQWLDRPSARVLEFAARRLESRPVGFLLSLRTGGSLPLGLDRSLGGRFDAIRVGPLSAGALHQLIKDRLGATFSRAELLRIHRATSGNPLFALELASSLLRAGAPAAGEALPVPDDVRELVAGRLRLLPGTTREMLFFAAAMPSPTVDTLRSAAGIVEADRRAARRRRGGRGRRRRRRVGALQASAVRVGDLRRRVERGAAAGAPAARGDLLEHGGARAAPRALRRGTGQRRGARRRGGRGRGPAARRAGGRRRARRAGDSADAGGRPDDRDRRALELGYYLVEAGDLERARGVVLAVADRPGPLRARALLDLAGLDYWGEGSRPAVARCEQALAAAAGDPALEAACHAELAVYCDFDAVRCERHARAALDLLDAAGDAADPDTLVDALLATTRASLLLGRGLPPDLIERAFRVGVARPRRASIDLASAHSSASG